MCGGNQSKKKAKRNKNSIVMAIKQIGILLLVIVASEYPKNNLICVTKSETRKQRSLALSKKERKHYGSNMCEKRNWNWNQKSRQFHRSTSPSRLHNNVKRTLCVESGIESKPPSIHSISPDSGVKKRNAERKRREEIAIMSTVVRVLALLPIFFINRNRFTFSQKFSTCQTEP